MNGKAFEEWAVLELMGHRRLAGRVSEETIGGASFIRIDVPGGATQFYAPGAVYCITPTTEQLARAFAEGNRPRPVERYELPASPRGAIGGNPGDDDQTGGSDDELSCA